MDFLNNSEESISSLNSIVKDLNLIDIEDLKTKDLTIINKNIDDYNSFFTTQQAEFVNYNKFSEHVFFDSAVNKVSYAFNKILNFPYDADKFNHDQYINKLEGYTGYIYRKVYPKNKSYIDFDRNQKLLIKNKNGAFLDDYENPKIGMLCPNERFSFNFWLKVKSNNFLNNQIIFKFFNEQNSSGFVFFISYNNNDNQKYYVNFLIVNNQQYKLEKTEFSLDVFKNITINVTNDFGKRKISFLIDGNKVQNSTYGNDPNTEMFVEDFHDSLRETNTQFILGSAESLSISLDDKEYIFENFSGCIDDFRYYHKIKSIKETKREIHKNIFAQKGLKLYLKFNEPGGNYLNSYVCLDSSGNKLHGVIISNNNQIIQDTTLNKISENTPLKLERSELSPVVNSKYSEISSIRDLLMTKAKDYDNKNNNLIFKLMPKHYFLEAADYQNLPVFSSADEIVNKKIVENELSQEIFNPETNTFESYQPANNHFVNILLIWARFFDQLKIMLDSISTIVDIDYDTLNEKKVLGLKIPLICRLYGLDFVEIFSSITDKKQNREALTFNDIVNDFSIRKIQNDIWYKILINSQSFLRSKGTINSIENIINSIGIGYSENISIREYSEINDLNNVEDQYIQSKSKYFSTNFINRRLLSLESTFKDSSSFSNEKPFLEIKDLKHFNKNNNDIYKNYLISDQDIKSGLGNNFSIEVYFKLDDFLKNKKNIESIVLENKDTINDIDSIQNILRIDYFNSPVVNAFFTRKNIDSNMFDLVIDIKPVVNSHIYNLELKIENIDLFDRENYLCIKQNLSDSTVNYEAVISKANHDFILEESKRVSASKTINNLNNLNLFSRQDSLNLRIGEYYYDDTTTQLFSIDNTNFQGEILNIRTWSKYLNNEEINNHRKSIKNISEDSIRNTNLVNNFYLKKEIEDSEIFNIDDKKYFELKNNSILKKESDNLCLNSCTFNIKSNVSLNSFVKYNEVLIKNKNFAIDTAIKQNRVNIISYNNENNKILTNNFNSFPSYSMPNDYNYDNANRLSVDFSIAKAINDDIARLITELKSFNEILEVNSMYNYSYKSYNELNIDYFNRLKDEKIINYNSLGNIFRYFDNILSSLLSEMMPSKTKFQGFNLVYESHILERHKYQHRNSNSRINIYSPSETYNFSREPIRSYRDSNYNSSRSMIDNVID